MKLIFATNNLHKLSEIKELTGNKIQINGLEESGYTGDIPEDFETLEKNASQKAWFIYDKLNKNCFADDTGLEVDALDGQPGVFSARYSRMQNDRFSEMDVVEGNINKLLENMKFMENRKARFRTVISLILDKREFRFEGIVNGSILKERWGGGGFGYDPVFLPEGYSKSFAQMNLNEKNKISHRARAMSELISFLKDYNN